MLNRRITIERYDASARNAFNEPEPVWSDYLTRIAAKRTDISDQEKVNAGQKQSATIARFVIRASANSRTIDAKDRISHEGDIWEITGIKETTHKKRMYLELTAVKDSDG